MAVYYTKSNEGLLTPVSQRICDWAVPRLPAWVMPNHITVLGFGLCLLSALSFYLGGMQRSWMLLAAFGQTAHWLTDNLDGALARQRQRRSARGFFLDIFLDNVGGASVALGLACASYTVSLLIMTAYMLFLLFALTTLLWIIVKQMFPLGVAEISPDEIRIVLALLAVLTFVHRAAVLQIAGHWLGWYDAFAVIMIPLSVFAITLSAVRLYRVLDLAT